MRVGKLRVGAACALVTGVLLSYQACSPQASFSSRQPAGQENLQLHNGGTTTDNPKATLDVSIMPHSVITIQQAQICVEDVQFKRVKPAAAQAAPNPFVSFLSMSYSQDRELSKAADKLADQLRGRDIYIVQEGAYIDAFAIPRGNFNVVELDLDDDCTTDSSLSLRVGANILKTNKKLTLKFDGNGMVDGSATLQLNMQPILEALAKAKSGAEFKQILSTVRGTFQ